jgi:AraC-like DNA-binding protein/quercetin dioxygenase-like cupin family protein
MNAVPSSLVLSNQDRRVEVSGFVLTETFRPAGLVLPPHFHEHANIGLTVEGSFIETVGTEPYEAHPTSVIFRPAGEQHSNHYGKTPARCLIIEVQPERLASIRLVTPILDRATHVEGGFVSNLAFRILRESRLPDAVAAFSIESLVLEMLVEATRVQCSRDRREPSWLCQARGMLDDRFMESVSLNDAATAVGVHAAHLAKMFRRYYGCTVGGYIRRLRLDHAAGLLVRSDQRLSAIALAAGFYDQSHFTHLFKLRFGVSPGEFRASCGRKLLVRARNPERPVPD